MPWMLIIEIGIKVFGYFMGWTKSKKESLEWMAKVSETLRQKGLVRSKFVLELEADRESYLLNKMKEMDAEPERKDATLSMQFAEERLAIPEFVRVPGVKFSKNGRFKTPSGKARGVVIHYTVSGGTEKSAKAVVNSLASRGLGCPVMDHEGKIYIPEDYDPLTDVVYHAGTSEWKGKTGISYHCIGLEVCSWGRLDATTRPRAVKIRKSEKVDNIAAGEYEAFTEKQEAAIIQFIQWVSKASPDFDQEWIVGHDEIAPTRKTDPGASLALSMPDFRKKMSLLL